MFRFHANVKRRAIMNPEQRTAVVAYLDALLIEVAAASSSTSTAPSATLGREARRFVGDFREVRQAAASTLSARPGGSRVSVRSSIRATVFVEGDPRAAAALGGAAAAVR